MHTTAETLPPVSSPEVAAAPAPLPPVTKVKIRKLAIVYAILFDLGVSMAFGALMAFIYIAAITKGTFIYFTDTAVEITSYTPLSVLTTIFGTLASLMAGYLAAQVGRSRPYAHAIWAGSILAVIMFLLNYQKFTMILTKMIEVRPADITSFLIGPLMIGMYVIGAFLYERVNEQL